MAKLPTLEYFLGLTPQKQVKAGCWIIISVLSGVLTWSTATSNAEIKSLREKQANSDKNCDSTIMQLTTKHNAEMTAVYQKQIDELKDKNKVLEELKQRAYEIIEHEEKKLNNAKK